MPGLTATRTGVIAQAYLSPGLPHLAAGGLSHAQWDPLREALTEAGAAAQAAHPDVLVIYSAQWISVLGHSLQYAARPTGLHVDENWHALGDFSYAFDTDRALTAEVERHARNAGLATRLVDYEGFPVDTGTLVTLQYFNPDNRLPVVVLSANIYAGQADSLKLGEATAQAIRESGKRAVLINCSSLSHRFVTEEIRPGEDHFSRPEDDAYNRRLLALLSEGKNAEALAWGPQYAQKAVAEMAFKGFYWLMGALGTPTHPARVLGYGPVWGTGAAIVQYDFSAEAATKGGAQ